MIGKLPEELFCYKDTADNEEERERPDSIIMREDSFDVSKIIPYIGKSIASYEYQPETWEHFIGQEKAKERAQEIIDGVVKQNIFSHILVDGIKGHGKTTFVELITKSLGAKLIERIGNQIDNRNLQDIINEINTSPEKIIILFIDEIETMDWRVLKTLNPIIQYFKIANIPIKPFICAGATINKHMLIDKVPDTVDRFLPFHIKFERYIATDIGKIVSKFSDVIYPNAKLTPEITKIITENCKFNPRTALGLLKEFVITNNINKVIKNCNIVKDGLTAIDVKLLNTLFKATRPMGANALAMKAGLSEKEYLREFEPFLCEYDYIDRTPSRVITEKGRELLKEIKL